MTPLSIFLSKSVTNLGKIYSESKQTITTRPKGKYIFIPKTYSRQRDTAIIPTFKLSISKINKTTRRKKNWYFSNRKFP
jgi:hypothetical protein